MHISKQQNDLLYRYEILRAKLEVRDHYFNAIVRDFYENTGQVLSLVKVQLAIIKKRLPHNIKADVSDSELLINEAISGLKAMSKNFFPENEILSESGLENAMKRELKIGHHEASNRQVTVKGIPFALTSENAMVFFFVVLEIVTYIVSLYGVLAVELEIIYSDSKLKLLIYYSGKLIDFDTRGDVHKSPSNARLGVKDRIQLIGGELIIKNANDKRYTIDIAMPYEKLTEG